jgi:hypothetical protein
MGQHATKAPAVIDWQLMQRTELDLTLSRRGLPCMPADLAARRILAALHEAAHLIGAVQYGVPVHRAFILGTRGQRTVSGAYGGVSIYDTEDTRKMAHFYYAGAAHDALMLPKGETFAFVNDGLCGSEMLIHYYRSIGTPIEKAPPGCDEFVSVINFLSQHWPAVRTLACAFLTYSDSKGDIDAGTTQTLCRHLKRDLLINRDDDGCYGDVLDRRTINRLEDVPVEKLEKYRQRKTTELFRRLERSGLMEAAAWHFDN